MFRPLDYIAVAGNTEGSEHRLSPFVSTLHRMKQIVTDL
jgi:hypothetical protein